MRSSTTLRNWSSLSNRRIIRNFPYQQVPRRVWSVSSHCSGPNANSRFSPSLCRFGLVNHPCYNNSSLCHYYHTSRPWRRLDHRQRQHHEDEKIQKCTHRIMALMEPMSANHGGVDPASLHATIGSTAMNHNTSTISQILRHLSPHARLEVERTVTKMTAHKIHLHHPHQHHHVAPLMVSANGTSASTEATMNGTTAVEVASTVTSSSTAAAASNVNIPEPPFSELRLLMYQQTIPFIGFGIMDNAILIIAGDAIDQFLGVSFGISTMCAAAIGNIVSDVAGVMLGTVVEDLCARLGLPTPHLSEAQRTLRSVRLASQTGICVGLVVGCIIGMFPLLWIDTSKTMRLKRHAKLQELVQDVMEEAKTLVQAERTTLFLRVASEDTHLTPTGEGQYLYAKYHANNHRQNRGKSNDGADVNIEAVTISVEGSNYGMTELPSNPGTGVTTAANLNSTANTIANPVAVPPTITSRLIPLGRGIVSRSALTGQALNLYHVQAEPDFDPDTFDLHHVTVKNMLCVPVLDEQGRAIAVIQAINKQKQTKRQQPMPSNASTEISKTIPVPSEAEEDGESSNQKDNMPLGFTSNDVQILKALASHISIALQSLHKDDSDVTMRHTIRTLKEHGSGILEQNQNPIRCRPLFPSDESGMKE